MNKNDKSRSITRSREVDPKSIKEFVVKEPIELLTFLLEKHPNLSRNNVKRILANHQVAVDGAPITQFNFMLAKEDIVIVSKNRIAYKKRDNLPIIYEDEEFIVINKPSGLLSVASDKIKGRTAYRMLMDYVQQKDKHKRIYVVHRLDEDTSGVMMVAKTSEIRDLLQKSWGSIVTSRGYYAIVEGVMEKKEDTLRNFLAENNLNLMYVTHNKTVGKECITRYKVISENKDYSLLDVHISSGRKNQIRVQLGHIGHFVIGDDKYGEPSDPLKRLGLHAYELSFIHPIKKKECKFVAPMPEEFKSLVFKKSKK
ncbi:MAG: RluA family pseudouridine synthase [Erysipelotrichia bacterium]|jgi:23S rRNA pseudouridine1911/1915/1917 synthase|nr:RluA family pseudouridine synthase [Bacilli bacterium]MDD4005593.1 RluA family pseudouridine synthase [Bacilli bacterium]NMV82120.1 RluA family pseudouridine synthase [Erysipelotrichia bacterium]